MYEIHQDGGMVFMVPLTAIFLVILGLICYGFGSLIMKKNISSSIPELIRQLGGLALAWGTFSTIIGLYFAFKSLSEMKDPLPLDVIMGGLKVGLITVIYGLIIFITSLAAFIGLQAMSKKSANS